MKTTKKIFKLILLLALFGIIYSFSFTTYENIKVNNMIKKFKKRADLNSEVLINVTNGGESYYRRYLEVPRETSKELNDQKNVFNDFEKNELGRNGDIFVTRDSPFPEKVLIHNFVSYYFGGHSALLYYENNNPNFIEATGFPTSDESIFDYIFNKGNALHDLHSTVSVNSKNYWTTPDRLNEYYFDMFYRDKYIGLRQVKNIDDDLYEQYINEAINKTYEKVESDSLYNFLFFINTRYKYYCTDLLGRSFDEAYNKVVNDKQEYKSKGYAKKMNDDGFISSVNDLILSRDTFIHFYVEINEEILNDEKVIVETIYYLSDVEV